MEQEFADVYTVIYQWPDDESCWRYGFIVHTNYDDPMIAAKHAGIADEHVLIYTDTLDYEEIEKHFDGLKLSIISGV